MKKVVALVLILALVMSLCACGSISSITEKIKEAKEASEQVEKPEEPEKPEKPEEPEKPEKPEKPNIEDEGNGRKEDIDTVENPEDSNKPQSPMEKWFADATFDIGDEDLVIADEQGIKITLTGTEFDTEDGKLILHILGENESDINIDLFIFDANINKCRVTPLIWDDIDAGKKNITEIEIYLEELMNYGIKDIYNMDFSIEMNNRDAWSESYYAKVKLEAVNAPYPNYKTDVEMAGTTLFEQDGIKIVSTGIYDAKYDSVRAGLFIKNDRADRISLDFSTIMANNAEYIGWKACGVSPGCCTFTEIEIDDTDLYAWDIEDASEINTISFDLVIEESMEELYSLPGTIITH